MILPKINANFILLVGERGVGKKYTLRESYKDAQFNVYWAPDISVDTIRTIIREAYKRHNTVFIIADADNMSITAKNALLKVVEECPNGNSFILTLQDENNTLPTIRSRATILRMQNPTPDELFQYFWEKYPDGNPNDAEKASAICSTYGEVDIVQKFGAMKFYDYVEKVIDYNALLTPTGEIKDVPNGATSAEIQAILDSLNDGDAIRFAENGVYHDISIYTTKNIKIIGNNATLYGLENANMADMPAEIKNLGIIYLAVLYSANNTNVAISDLNIKSRYPDHGMLLGTTPSNEYKTAGIYAMKSENIVITNCKVDGASFGIMLHFMAGVGGCANAIVTNNYVSNQFTYGILNFGSKASYIANNTVVNAKWHGIDVRHQMGPNVVVYNNTVIGSSEGIYLMHSHGHKVYDNVVKNCKVSSITAYGSVGTAVNNIYIFNNTLQGSRIGILVGGGNQNVTIGKNTYSLDAQKSGDKPGFGLYLVQSESAYDAAENVPGVYNDQEDITLEAGDATVGYKNGEYTIKVTDKNGQPLANSIGTITVNNEKYDIKTDANGTATIKLNLTPGTYEIETSIDSTYYYASAYKLATVTVTDDRVIPSLTATNPTVYLQAVEKGSKYQVTLKDDGGKAIAGKEITVTFNGATYKATTDANGIATFTLKATKTGSLKATISFAGDEGKKLDESIARYLDVTRGAKAHTQETKLNEQWSEYLELLTYQNAKRGQYYESATGEYKSVMIPEGCAVNFKHGGDDYKEGGKCYYAK